MVFCNASRSAPATISTVPVRASCATTVTSPFPFAKSSVSRSRTLVTVSRPRKNRYAEYRPRFVIERGIRGDGALSERRRDAIITCVYAAGFDDRGIERRGIPIRETRIDHHLGTPRGDEKVAVTITPIPRDRGS